MAQFPFFLMADNGPIGQGTISTPKAKRNAMHVLFRALQSINLPMQEIFILQEKEKEKKEKFTREMIRIKGHKQI